MQWHPQIHRRTAEREGRKPEDFTWLHYPVSNVRLLRPWQGIPLTWDLVYLANMPVDTPLLNQYIEEKDRQEGVEYEPAGAPGWLKIPDAVGSALARLGYSLIDVSDGAVLEYSGNDTVVNGEVLSGLGEARGAELWKRLTPGTSLRVRLDATPFFFPYNKDGDGGNHYSTVNRGYLNGETSSSTEHTLSADEDMNLFLDGEPTRGEPTG